MVGLIDFFLFETHSKFKVFSSYGFSMSWQVVENAVYLNFERTMYLTVLLDETWNSAVVLEWLRSLWKILALVSKLEQKVAF